MNPLKLAPIGILMAMPMANAQESVSYAHQLAALMRVINDSAMCGALAKIDIEALDIGIRALEPPLQERQQAEGAKERSLWDMAYEPTSGSADQIYATTMADIRSTTNEKSKRKAARGYVDFWIAECVALAGDPITSAYVQPDPIKSAMARPIMIEDLLSDAAKDR